MNGLELSRQYYEEFGAPMLREQFPELEHLIAVGLAGSGSECFGYDDELSRDHDFEPGFCIFLPGEELLDRRNAFLLERAYAKLPKEFLGFRRNPISPAGGSRHGAVRIADFFTRLTGTGDGCLSSGDWLSLPENYLAEAVNGEIFRDDLGLITEIRGRLSFFPEDLMLKKLAGCLFLMGQAGQYNYPRCLSRNDTAAAQLAVFEFTRHAAHAAFLLSGKYMPYYKWVFRGLRELPDFGPLTGMLEYLITAGCDGETAENKRWVIEDVVSQFIEILQERGLTDAVCGDAQKHAQSVNDRIGDSGIRNLNLLAGVE